MSMAERIWADTGRSRADCEEALDRILSGQDDTAAYDQIAAALRKHFGEPDSRIAELADNLELDELAEDVKELETSIRSYRYYVPLRVRDIETGYNMSINEALDIVAQFRAGRVREKSQMPFRAWALATGYDEAFKDALKRLNKWGEKEMPGLLEGRDPESKPPTEAAEIYERYLAACDAAMVYRQDSESAVGGYSWKALRYYNLINMEG